jgi:cytochrome P450
MVHISSDGGASQVCAIMRYIMNESQAQASPTGLLLFNPLSKDFLPDPYPTYHRLRLLEPVHRSPLGFQVLSRHADIAFVLRDRRFGRDFAARIRRTYGEEALDEPIYRSMRLWMLNQNPPDHTRLRGLVAKAFSTRAVEDMRPHIQAIVTRSLDRLIPQGQMDLIADFALKLPVTVICEMLGIPEEDHAMFLAGARSNARLLDPVPLTRHELDAANAGNSALASYFEALFELRRRKPKDDLVTVLLQAEEEGKKLTNEELIANLILLFGAGHETTVNLIGNSVLALYRNPAELRRLREDPTLETAADEFLRYDSPVQVTARTALEPVEIDGVEIGKGEQVMCLLGAANRDPAVYPDPDRLDLGREKVRPLSFGGGIHFCLGAQLARIEAEIAIASLLTRLPGMRLDETEAPDWRPAFVLRGLNTLQVQW